MEQNIKLELTLNEVNVILAGLAELPFKASADVINKIRMAALPQIGSASQTNPPEDGEANND